MILIPLCDDANWVVAPDLLPVVDPLPDLRIDTADEEEENVAAEMELGGTSVPASMQ